MDPEVLPASNGGAVYLKRALHKFPEILSANNVRMVGITVFGTPGDEMVSRVAAELESASNIDVVAIRSLANEFVFVSHDPELLAFFSQQISQPWFEDFPVSVILPSIEERSRRMSVWTPIPEKTATRGFGTWTVAPKIRLERSQQELVGNYRAKIDGRGPDDEPKFVPIPEFPPVDS